MSKLDSNPIPGLLPFKAVRLVQLLQYCFSTTIEWICIAAHFHRYSKMIRKCFSFHLNAPKNLYEKVCLSVCPSVHSIQNALQISIRGVSVCPLVRRSVGPSVRQSVGPSVRNTFSQTRARRILCRLFGLVHLHTTSTKF